MNAALMVKLALDNQKASLNLRMDRLVWEADVLAKRIERLVQEYRVKYADKPVTRAHFGRAKNDKPPAV